MTQAGAPSLAGRSCDTSSCDGHSTFVLGIVVVVEPAFSVIAVIAACRAAIASPKLSAVAVVRERAEIAERRAEIVSATLWDTLGDVKEFTRALGVRRLPALVCDELRAVRSATGVSPSLRNDTRRWRRPS